jgi:DNA-directed RNA polymerase II subunit RPB3
MNPKVTTVEEEANILKFTLACVNVSLANALRRAIINDIQTVVFRTETFDDNKCVITSNTGRLHNEILKQRLGCIPIHSTDLDELTDKYILEINETNDNDHIMIITTEHFKIKEKESGAYISDIDRQRIFPPDMKTGHYIDFARIRPRIGDVPGEQLKLTCEFSVANAGVNSMFNVVSKCAYGYTPDMRKIKEAWEHVENKMKASGATVDEIHYRKKDFYFLDAQRHFTKDSFDFVVESVGVFSNTDIVKKACMVLQKKLDTFFSNIDEHTVPIEPSPTTMNHSFDVVLENEDYTLGKALEYYLYDKYYVQEKKLNFCAFKKLHPHDSSSRLRLAYMTNVSETNIQNDLKNACRDLKDVYVAIYKMF